ncbi:MAG: amidohydrolase family protein [Synechococcaceae cyanobacterium]|nr:amidohydrolase family protein [Synechococcaceae cyanobacterium]
MHPTIRSLTAFTILAMPWVASAAEPTMQDLGNSLSSPVPVVISRAKQIVTLDPARPSVQAVAVAGDRILATGSLADVKAAAGRRPYRVDDTFATQVVVPGFIAQHDHPLLAGLTMTSQIIAIEDWVLPRGTAKAARNRQEYLRRLAEANARLRDPSALLLTWGYHQYFHGPLKKADLDAISTTRPIIVWHRSAHEVVLNSVAEKTYGLTRPWFDSLPESAKKQADFANAHYWEQGMFGVLPRIAPAMASPERIRAGLEFVKEYYHANGVTLGAEPGGLASKPLQEAENAVLSDSSSPFRFYFIADGKSITGAFPDDKVAAETTKLLSWGRGMTAFLPMQVKLFADGAIFSQAMQVSEGYSDGHKGEWMMDPEFFARSFRVYWDLGYQIHVHVNGDAGLDLVLDELERNQRRLPRTDHRTVIVHFAVSRPEQVARIKRLGAIVSGNPYYPAALADNYRNNGLDPERPDAMVRMGDVERAGISYSYHSDMPMAPGQPLFLIWAGVNRITNDGNVRAPQQRVSRLGALRAVTLDAAYSLRLEKEVGSIVPGKLANFTILAANPLTIDPVRIKDIPVWGTVQEGRVLPVRRSSAPGHVSRLGPVLDRTGIAAWNAIGSAEQREARRGSEDALVDHSHWDPCQFARRLATVISSGTTRNTPFTPDGAGPVQLHPSTDTR